MSHAFSEGGELLERHYGWLAIPEVEKSWERACLIVLNQGAKKERLKAGAFRETLLERAEEVAELSVAELGEALEQLQVPGKSAGTLKRLARWWCEVVLSGEEGELPLEELRGGLVKIPGISGELGDRILMLVLGREAVPLDRGVMRIAVRHGWVDATAEYEEWQSFFLRGCEQAGVELIPFVTQLRQVGRDFCGAQPACEGCPLKPLLPASGPYEVEG